ncbi:MAG: hypothetical protein R3314_08470 [Longimicrobiales bacterium]|nr:hypothetical protein [Longimicrobiales bacterium]
MLAGLAAVLPGPGAAQNVGAGGPALELGVLVHGQRDAAASPMRYTGAGPELGVAWYRSTPRWRADVRGSLGVGTLRSSLTANGLPAEDLWAARLGLRYLRVLGTAAGGRAALLVGGDLTAHGAYRRHRYPVDRTEHFADVLIPLSVVAGWEWGAGPIRVAHRAWLPVVGLAVRTPWGGLKYAPRVEMAGPVGLTGFGQTMYVEAAVTGLLHLRIGWTLDVLHHDDPRSLDMASHRILVSGLLGGSGS